MQALEVKYIPRLQWYVYRASLHILGTIICRDMQCASLQRKKNLCLLLCSFTIFAHYCDVHVMFEQGWQFYFYKFRTLSYSSPYSFLLKIDKSSREFFSIICLYYFFVRVSWKPISSRGYNKHDDYSNYRMHTAVQDSWPRLACLFALLLV